MQVPEESTPPSPQKEVCFWLLAKWRETKKILDKLLKQTHIPRSIDLDVTVREAA